MTAIGWEMKDEPVIKNSARARERFGNLDIKNCCRILRVINGETPRKVSASAVCECDSGPITAARRKLKVEGANKPETRYFGFHSGFGFIERILYPYSSVIAGDKISFGYTYVILYRLLDTETSKLLT